MNVKLVRNETTLELDEQHLRALASAVLDAQRAAYGRSFHAQREGRLRQAQEHLVHVGRLQRLADFLIGRNDDRKQTD